MDIFIKSFNRPFLLDKCLASIKMFAKKFNGKIILLDDGTPQKYINKILEKYPDVQLLKSEFYSEKANAIEHNLEPQNNIPSLFWKKSISKSTEYFVLLEDDMWFCDVVDFVELENQMIENQLQLVKMLWMGNNKLISSHVEKRTNFLAITKPKLFTRNSFIYTIIYQKKYFKIDAIINRLGVKVEENFLKYYQVYSVAGAAYSKEYYLNAWKTTQNKVDELAQIRQVIQTPKTMLNVANSKKEWIKTSLKTTASKQNKEHLNSDFDVYSLNRILNECWFNNQFESYDFKNDITNGFIQKVILDNNLPSNTFNLWLNWYQKLKQSYVDIGCEIANDE